MLAKDTAARPAMREVMAELGNLRQLRISAASATPGSGVVAHTVHLSDSRHTTLGQATGQQHKSTLRTLHLLLAVGCVVAVGLGGLALTRKARSSTPVTSPAVSVRWHIQSEPPGAEVVIEPGGKVLGQTPLDYSAATAVGAQTVVLRQPGFLERRLSLSRSTSEERRETLIPAPPPAVPPIAAELPNTTAKPAKPPEPVKPAPTKPTPAPASKPTSPAKRPPSPLRNDQVPLFR